MSDKETILKRLTIARNYFLDLLDKPAPFDEETTPTAIDTSRGKVSTKRVYKRWYFMHLKDIEQCLRELA